MSEKYHIVMIGAGAGGLQCAIHAAGRGVRCAVIDGMEVGGECLQYGCIPSKSMVQSMDTYRLVKNASAMGIDIGGDVAYNFSRIMARNKTVVNGIVGRVHKGLSKMKIDFYRGTGSVTSPNKVTITPNNPQPEQEREIILETENIVIGTGSYPNRLSIPGADLPGVLTNREIFDLKNLPKSMVVIGCGYVGVELATIFASMGTRVKMLEKEEFLMGFDQKIAQIVRHSIEERQGVDVEIDLNVLEIQHTDAGLYNVVYEKDDHERSAQGEVVLMATGRTPYTEALWDGDIRIAMDGPGIAVNEYLETSVQGIYALGDVLNGAMTAFTAATEGEVVADNCLGKRVSIDYSAVPRCVFTYPAYACVGLNEEEANSTEGLNYGIAEYPFRAIAMADIMNETEGFIRLIYEKGSGKILGGHIVGAHASELIAELTLAVHQGLNVKELASVLHFHPSLAEGLQRAARVGWLMEDMGK